MAWYWWVAIGYGALAVLGGLIAIVQRLRDDGTGLPPGVSGIVVGTRREGESDLALAVRQRSEENARRDEEVERAVRMIVDLVLAIPLPPPGRTPGELAPEEPTERHELRHGGEESSDQDSIIPPSSRGGIPPRRWRDPPYRGEISSAAELEQSIRDFATDPARTGYTTNFETVHVVRGLWRIFIFLRHPALRSLARERPQANGGQSREYFRTGQDSWAFIERTIKATEVEEAIERAQADVRLDEDYSNTLFAGGRVTVSCPQCALGHRLPADRSGDVVCRGCGTTFHADTHVLG